MGFEQGAEFVRRFIGMALSLGILAAVMGNARAEIVRITVTNQGNSSFSLTPLWFGFDDGTFDLFTPGGTASNSLRDLAEEGIVSGLAADFGMAGAQGVVGAPGGFGPAPVIEPGETGSALVDVDFMQERFLNFASMVIPSNDSFFGTPAPIEIFDAAGNFVGGGNSRSIQLFGNQIWDAGTEVNNTMGAAFSTVGGSGSLENGTVQLLAAGGLDNFLNTGTPIGTITDLISPSEAFATITVSAVPEPSSLLLLAAGVGAFSQIRRRRS